LFPCAVGIGILAAILFTKFLPRSKEHCQEIKEKGDNDNKESKTRRAVISLVLTAIIVVYGVVAVCLLLDSRTSCLEIVGGTGC